MCVCVDTVYRSECVFVSTLPIGLSVSVCVDTVYRSESVFVSTLSRSESVFVSTRCRDLLNEITYNTLKALR